MNKLDIGAIRGDLNTFKRMVKAVEFAADAIDDHEAREARCRELDKQSQHLGEQVTNGKASLDAVNQRIRDAEVDADMVVNKATVESDRIIQQAKNEASTIRSTANTEADSVKLETATKRKKIEQLNKDIKALGEQKSSAQAELEKITKSVESALNGLKKA